MRQRKRKKDEREYCSPTHEGEEVPVVSAPDAVVEPDAVVVRGLDAVVAHPTVVGSRGPPDVAGFTVLGRYLHRCGRRLCRLDERPIISRRP